MAHNLKLSVIAEGVETHAQQAFLAHQQCDEIQGYLLSKPLLPDDLAALLRRCQSETLRYDEGEKKSRSGRRLSAMKSAIGLVATTMLATNEVRVIITDYAMPGMKGTQLLKRVRELYPRVMRILLSGQISTEILAAAINDGAVVKFLAKPVSEVELLTTLQHALRSADAALQSP